MSEQAPFNPEAFERKEVDRELPEHAGTTHEQAVETSKQDISEIRASVQENAAEASVVNAQTQEPPAPAQPQAPINQALKAITVNRSLSHIRHNLGGGDKAFSKVIHQPVVRSASELGARTVGRPIALLVGGVCALLGSSVYLYLAKHIGFEYNYLVSTMLFVGGLIVGLLLEGIFNLLGRGKKPHRL